MYIFTAPMTYALSDCPEHIICAPILIHLPILVFPMSTTGLLDRRLTYTRCCSRKFRGRRPCVAFCGVLQRTWATVGHWGVEMEHVAESAAPATHAAAQTEGESLSPKATDSPPCRTYPTLAREPLAVSPLSSGKFGRACVEYIKFARKMASPHRHGIEVHTHPVNGCAACYKKMHLATYDMCFKTLQLESATKREVVHDVCTPPGSPSPCTHGVFETSFICAAITALELS
jgi:hypothetical protein